MTQNYFDAFTYAREKHHFSGDFSRELSEMVCKKRNAENVVVNDV